MDSGSNQNVLSDLIKEINSVLAKVQKTTPRLVRAKTEIDSVRSLTQLYFRSARKSAVDAGLDVTSLDPHFSELLELTGKDSVRSSYVYHLKQAQRKAGALEVQYEFSFSTAVRVPSESLANRENEVSKLEQAIIDTLNKINPFFADAYTQIVADLVDIHRVSYRGVVHEMRELLRGILNHFAPDAEVMAQEGFVLEPKQVKPTRTQKMNFILKSRGLSSAQRDPAMKATGYLDVQLDILSSMPSAIYGAGSDSAHADPKDLRNEVNRLKRYLDAMLCDILEIS